VGTNEATIGLILLLTFVVGIIAITTLLARSEGSKVSNRLFHALHEVRLFRALKRARVDPMAYVQTTDVARIREQIATCRSCAETQLCDTALEGEAAATSDFSFCPNRTTIESAKEATVGEGADR